MERTHATLAAVCIVAVLLFSLLALYRHNKHIEGFQNTSLQQDYLSTVYKNKGIERCDALYADPVKRGEIRAEMTEKSITPMDNMILGFRMREWLPSSSVQQVQLDQNSKYCYMLFDSNNQAIDPLLKNEKCDDTNPIFQNIDFINKVFVDSNADISHTLPYNKCVVEIDTSRVDSLSLSSFWTRTGETQCSNLQAQATQELKTYVSRFTASNKELRTFRDLHSKYTSCSSNQNNLYASLSNLQYQYAYSNCAFKGQDCDTKFVSANNEASLITLENEKDRLAASLNSKTISIRDLDASIARIQRRTREEERKLNELNAALQTTKNVFERCSNVDLPETIRAFQDLITEHESLQTASNLLAQQYTTCRRSLSNVTLQYNKLVADTNAAKASYDGSNALLITCRSTNDYLQQNINTLKDSTQRFATQCNDCTSALILRIAEEQSLRKDTVNLTLERDDWLRRCQFDQRKMLDQSVQTINELRAASSSHTRQACGNDMTEAQAVNDLIQRKAAALAQLNQPLNCAARETERSQCCAQRGME